MLVGTKSRIVLDFLFLLPVLRIARFYLIGHILQKIWNKRKKHAHEAMPFLARSKAFCKNESRLTWLRRILRSARASSLTRGKDALRSPAELAKAAAGGLSLRHPRRAPIAHRSSRPNAGTRETLARRAQDTVPPGGNRYFILQNALAGPRRH